MNKEYIFEDRISSPSTLKSRLLVSIIIALYILWQIILPASYYIGSGHEIYDERFSWRMFSSVGMSPCSVDIEQRITEPGGNSYVKDFDLKRLDPIWVSQLASKVIPVSEKLLRKRCKSHTWIEKVTYIRNCRSPSGEKFRDDYNLTLDCSTGKFSSSGERR